MGPDEEGEVIKADRRRPPGWRWDRAAGPAIVLVTFRKPGVASYTSVKFTGTTLPAGTVMVWPLPDTVAVTVALAPSAVR